MLTPKLHLSQLSTVTASQSALNCHRRYIRIAMKDKMCGIATQPMYVELDVQQ